MLVNYLVLMVKPCTCIFVALSNIVKQNCVNKTMTVTVSTKMYQAGQGSVLLVMSADPRSRGMKYITPSISIMSLVSRLL